MSNCIAVAIEYLYTLFTRVSIIQHITMSLRTRKGEAIPEFARSLLRRATALLAMTECASKNTLVTERSLVSKSGWNMKEEATMM